ncbi:MAG TPA: hypothetical protein VH815_10285 [Acidobacteriota bacterium]
MSNIFQKPPYNYQNVIGIQNYADVNVSPAIQTGIVTTQPLQSIVLAANIFKQDGQLVEVFAGFTETGTGNKGFQITLNGTVIYTQQSMPSANNAGDLLRTRIIRLTPTTIFCYSEISHGATLAPATAGSPTVNANYISLAFDPAQPITLQYNATIPTGGDTITQQFSVAFIS